MSVKLLTEHHLEFLRLKGGFRGSSKPTLVKIPHCWKSHTAAPYYYSKIDQGELKVTIRTNDDVHVSWKSVHWFRRRFLKEFLAKMGVTAVLVM